MNPTKGAEVSDLTQFLLARIAEDYADAMSGWRWKSLPAGEYERLQARVLRECEAKRRIVEAWEDERQRKDIYNRDYPLGLLTTDGDLRARLSANARWAGLDVAAGALASVYADHADYREEWCP